MQTALHYRTDDRDYPLEKQRTLVLAQGGNGDWYVSIGNSKGDVDPYASVRLSTSGGAATQCPGLTYAIADAYTAMAAAKNKGAPAQHSYADLKDELAAWKAKFPDSEYRFGGIWPKDTG